MTSRPRRLLSFAVPALALTLGAGAPGGVPVASACSPLEKGPSYWTIGVVQPADGSSEVALDAPIRIGLSSAEGGDPPERVAVTVHELVTGAAVPGHTVEDYTTLWRPTSPLRPHTSYRVEAEVKSNAPRPAHANRPAMVAFIFTTGAQPTPPIQLAGSMEVRLERYDRESHDGSCTMNPPQRGTRLRVKLPAVSGGRPDPMYGTYTVGLAVTADRPYDFSGRFGSTPPAPFSATGDSTEPTIRKEVVVEDVDWSRSYRPCVALRVTDALGNEALGTPICLTATVPPTESIGGGCSVAPRGGGLPLAPVVVVLALALRRRRRG